MTREAQVPGRSLGIAVTHPQLLIQVTFKGGAIVRLKKLFFSGKSGKTKK